MVHTKVGKCRRVENIGGRRPLAQERTGSMARVGERRDGGAALGMRGGGAASRAVTQRSRYCGTCADDRCRIGWERWAACVGAQAACGGCGLEPLRRTGCSVRVAVRCVGRDVACGAAVLRWGGARGGSSLAGGRGRRAASGRHHEPSHRTGDGRWRSRWRAIADARWVADLRGLERWLVGG